jgi:hypothetical protein
VLNERTPPCKEARKTYSTFSFFGRNCKDSVFLFIYLFICAFSVPQTRKALAIN